MLFTCLSVENVFEIKESEWNLFHQVCMGSMLCWKYVLLDKRYVNFTLRWFLKALIAELDYWRNHDIVYIFVSRDSTIISFVNVTKHQFWTQVFVSPHKSFFNAFFCALIQLLLGCLAEIDVAQLRDEDLLVVLWLELPEMSLS